MRDKQLLWGAIVVILACFAIVVGVTVFYNATHEARALDRESFQAVVLALMAVALFACLAATWFGASIRDEVVSTADRVSIYWAWVIGVVVWILTLLLPSLPEEVARLFSNPEGDTLFTLSEATGAYMGGGLMLVVIVSVCASIIKVCWWVAKR